ncbi:tetratricopeptide repeat protein [Helicobacter pylori]
MRLGNVSGKVEDFIRGRKYIEKACELNEMFGCLSLVSNSQINKQKLFQYHLSKACELNSGNGCRFLGDFYENGKYVKKDLRKAAQYYSKACKLGDQETCEVLKEK